MITILIPAKNEIYIQKTINDILEKSQAKILVGLDGWKTKIEPNPRVKVLYKESIGQRAMTNELARMADTKYVMKTDAHCSFSKDFDKEMLALMEDDITMTPVMCRLDAENWQIIPKPRCVCYCFDKDLIFDYWEEREDVDQNTLTETLALQGSCFLVTKKKYFELNLCDEKFGSWGMQGVEVALKTWLSGGRVVTNRNAFYGHFFRKEEDFPYERDMAHLERTKSQIKDIYTKHKNFNQLIEKFKPIRHWHAT